MIANIYRISPDGNRVQTIHNDDIDYAALGTNTIRRASHVEPTEDGQWTADLAPVGGPLFGPYPKRHQALRAEIRYLRQRLMESTIEMN